MNSSSELASVTSWEDLKYFETGEWQVVEERLDELDRKGTLYNPSRELLFAALDATPLDMVRVAIIGQDPYPDREYCSGLAFSVPASCQRIPASLSTIFDEYQKDLHHDRPKNGDLTPWAERGVLLWNSIPTCLVGKSMSHDWDEWGYLTEEILTVLSTKDIVFINIGLVSLRYMKKLSLSSTIFNNLKIISVSHPSPRASKVAKHPFLGSRIFSRANAMLVELGKEPIDWRI